jgi:hypothetical protein
MQARDDASPRPLPALHQPADAAEDALLHEGGARGLLVRVRSPFKTDAPVCLSPSGGWEAWW